LAKDLLRLDDLSGECITVLARRAGELARLWADRDMPQVLAGRRIGLINDAVGWRNTTALGLGIQAMGGLCIEVPVSLEGTEDRADLGRYLDNWFDLVAVRCGDLESLGALAGSMRAPVVNLRTRANHPCEILGDLSYVFQRLGGLDGLCVVVAAPRGNILQSWVEAARVLPIRVVQVAPVAFWHGEIESRADLAVTAEADVIVTDCWPTGHDGAFAGFRVTGEILDRAGSQCLFLPCPPVDRGQEVTAASMLHPKQCAYAAKGFLLHGQNAVLEYLLTAPAG